MSCKNSTGWHQSVVNLSCLVIRSLVSVRVAGAVFKAAESASIDAKAAEVKAADAAAACDALWRNHRHELESCAPSYLVQLVKAQSLRGTVSDKAHLFSLLLHLAKQSWSEIPAGPRVYCAPLVDPQGRTKPEDTGIDLHFGPSVVRGRPVYDMDSKSKKSESSVGDCNKSVSRTVGHTGGIFSFFCPHSYCYG